MTRSTTPDAKVIYAYGLVQAGFAPERLPAGIDGAAVTVERVGGVGVLVSRLPANEYDAASIERSSADVPWLSERATAHDRVLTWTHEHGGVIPLPIFTMFGSSAALAKSLGDRAAALPAVFARVADADEFGVRVHRHDERMLAFVPRLDPALGQLRAEADVASPGQRYLIERKIAELSKGAVRSASQRIARQVFARLEELARESVSRPIVPDPSRAPDATLVLNGAFLVDRARVDAFRAAVAGCIREYEEAGLVFDFTGPWPPYNFVGGVEMGAAAAT